MGDQLPFLDFGLEVFADLCGLAENIAEKELKIRKEMLAEPLRENNFMLETANEQIKNITSLLSCYREQTNRSKDDHLTAFVLETANEQIKTSLHCFHATESKRTDRKITTSRPLC